MRPILQAVDAAYSLEGDEATWLDRVLFSLQDALAADRGVCALPYEVGPDGPVIHSALVVGVDRAAAAGIVHFFENAIARADRSAIEQVFRAPRRPVSSTSEIIGAAGVMELFAAEAASQAAVPARDFVGGRVQRTDMGGYILGALTGAPVRLGRANRAEITRLYAHIEAAARLRGARRSVATIARGGVSNVSDDEVRAALPHLHRTHSEMIASRQGERDLGGWSTRVDARYSLVPTGRAGEAEVVTNGLSVATSALAGEDPRVQGVARLLAEGHPQKLISYELGIPEGSVYRHVARLKRLFGETTTVGLVARLGSETAAPNTSERRAGREAYLAPLSPAERFAVEGALRGLSAAEMGAARGVSVRTAENVLRSAYQKLGVGSRKELAAKVG